MKNYTLFLKIPIIIILFIFYQSFVFAQVPQSKFIVDAGHDVSINNGGNIKLTVKINDGDGMGVGQFVGFTYQGRIADHFYYSSNYATNWKQAKADCENSLGHLVTIGDVTENNLVYAIVSGVTDHAFIGLTDELAEGTWRWVTFEPFIYKNWYGGYPNGGTGKNYAFMYNNGNKQWMDDAATTSRRFILEMEPTIKYKWSTGGTSSSITVSPQITTTYTVTITVNGREETDNVVVTVNNPLLYAGVDQTIISGKNAKLSASGGDGNYTWSNGEYYTNIVVAPTKTTTYILMDGSGKSDNVVIFVNPSSGANAGGDITICNGATATLNAKTADTWTWSTGAKTQQINVAPTKTTTYTLTVKIGATTSTDNVVVTVSPKAVISAGYDAITNNGTAVNLSASINVNDGTGIGYIENFVYRGRIGDNFYYSANNADTWENANSLCTFNQGHLVTISSDAENDLVYTIVSGVTDHGFIGLTDKQGENTFRWVTREPYSYTKWYGGYPNNSGNKDYVFMYNNGNKQWMDDAASTKRKYTMEIEPDIKYKWNTNEFKKTISVKPGYTTTYNLSVTVNGCMSTDDVVVNVLNPSLYAGPDQTIVKGKSANLEASGSSGKYKWSTGEEYANITVYPTVTTTYTVYDNLANADDVVIYVTNSTSANAGPNVTICNGNATTLTATGGTAFSWSTKETTASITVQPTTTTTYVVTVTKSGITSSDALVVTVSPSFIPDAGKDVGINNGASATLTASINIGDATGIGTIPGFTYQGKINENYYYSSNYTDTWLNAKKACEDNNGHLVTISSDAENNLVYAIVSGVTDNAFIGLTDQVSEGVWRWVTREPYTTYTKWYGGYPNNSGNKDYVFMYNNGNKQWMDDAASISRRFILEVEPDIKYNWSTGESTKSISVKPNRTTTYYITATVNGCQKYDNVVVTVNNASVYAGEDVTIYKGNNTELIASGGDGNYTWLTSPNQNLKNIVVAPTITTEYTVLDGKNDGDKVMVYVINAPGANAGPDYSICKGSSVTLKGSGGGTYTWSTGATTQNITVNPNVTTTYILTVVKSGLTTTDNAVVTVSPNFVADAGTDVVITRGNPVTLNANINGGLGSIDNFVYRNKIGNNYYYSSNFDATWSNAKYACEQNNGHLVTISSDAENDLVYSIVSGVTDHGFIGLTDEKAENTFRWVTREPYSYTKWYGGYPNNSGNKDYVFMYNNGNKQWMDDAATTKRKFTMEIEPKINYEWSTGNTSKSITLKPSVSTMYNVTITSNACTATSMVYVSVTGTNAYAGEDITICKGAQATLTALPDNADEYSWSTKEITQSIKVSPTVNTTYKLTLTNGGVTTSDEVAVIIAAPSVDAGIDLTNYSDCPVTLTATGANAYNWNTGEKTASIIVKPTVTSTYKVTGTDKNGCTASDQAKVTVNNTSPADAGADKALCFGNTVQLTAKGGSAYIWSNGSTTPSIDVGPTVTSKYKVTVTIANECSGMDSVTVTVYKTTPDAGVDQIIPIGSSAVLIATGADFYTWINKNTGATVSSGAKITVKPTVTTTYVVNGLKNGCSGSDEVIVNVKSVIANAGPDMTICKGTTVTINGSGGTIYKWSNGDSTASITVKPNVTTTYTLSIDKGGTTDEDFMVVYVTTKIILDAGPDQTIPEGATAQLIVSGWGTYQWSTGSSNDTINVSPTKTTTYSVTATSSACTGVDQVTVVVNPKIIVDAGIDQTTCKGGSVELTASGADNYTWNTGEQKATISVSPTVTTTYRVTGEKGGSTDTDLVVVVVATKITVTASSDITICSGNAKLTASGASTYSWSNGGTTSSITVKPTVRTTYYVTGTSGSCTAKDNVIVTPVLAITADAGPDDTMCKSDSIILNASGGTDYKWSTGATTASTTVKPTTNTTFTVTVTGWGCNATDNVKITIINTVPANAGTDQTINYGQSVTLTATGGKTYKWSTGKTTSTINVNPTVKTTYTVTAYWGTCTGIDKVVVTVKSSALADAGPDKTICDGEQAILVAKGGNTYVWSTGWTLDSLFVSPSITTTYSVTVTGTAGATDSDYAVVYVNPIPTVDAGANKTINIGDNIILTATGADTYIWSTTATTSSITVAPTSKTTYKVTGYSAGCSASDNVVVSVTNNVVADAGPDKTICEGNSTTITGTGNGTYKWSTGATTASIIVNPTKTTTYTLVVTNSGNTASDDMVVFVNSIPSADAGADITILNGTSGTLTASGGDSYLWNNSNTNASITVSPTTNTTYKVTVTKSSCTASDQVVVFVTDQVIADAGPNKTVCKGETTTLTGNGGTVYSWSNLATTQTISVTPNLTTTYYLTVSHNGKSDTDFAIVYVNPIPSADAGSDKTIEIGDNTTLTASGGTVYSWSTSQTSQTITVNPTVNSNYSVTVTFSGCSASDNVNVIVIPKLTVDAGSDESICFGENTTLTVVSNGSVKWSNNSTNKSITVSPSITTTYTVTVSNGTNSKTDDVIVFVIPLPNVYAGKDIKINQGTTTTINVTGANSYKWNDNSSMDYIVVAPTIQTTYSVTGYINNCSASDEVVVSIRPPYAGPDKTICQGQSVTLTALDADSYLWSTGETTKSIIVKPSATKNYSITVDNNGAKDEAVAIVTVFDAPLVYVTDDKTICQGEEVNLYATDGDSYLWNDGDTSSFRKIKPLVTQQYYVTVTKNGCSASENVNIKVLNNPYIELGNPKTICAGNRTLIKATQADKYIWNNGETKSYIIVYPTVNTTYYLTAFNTDGCSASDNIVVNATALPNVDAGSDKTICDGNAVTLNASGATNYYWSNGMSVASITVAPTETTVYSVAGYNNGCYNYDYVTVVVNIKADNIKPIKDIYINKGDSAFIIAPYADSYKWNTGAINQVLKLKPTVNTTYTLTMTINSCFYTDDVCVNIMNKITVDAGNNQTICDGGNATLIASGATTYKWSNGATSAKIIVNPAVSTTYAVTGYSNGASASDIVVVNITEPLSTYAGEDVIICKGGKAYLSAIGGDKFLWSNDSISQNIVVSPSLKTTYTITAHSGTCSATDNVVVDVQTKIQAYAGEDVTICRDEQVKLSSIGGESYKWNSGQTTQTISVSPNNSYTYIVTAYSNGCTATDDVIITIKQNPVISVPSVISICKNMPTLISASGGDNYFWSSGQTTQSITVEPTNNSIYNVTAYKNNCQATKSVNVIVNPALSLSAGDDVTICKNVAFTLKASGATTYSWSTGSSTAAININPTNTTIYKVTGYAGDCYATDEVTVSVVSSIVAKAGEDQYICNNGKTILTGSGGSSYSWNTGQITQSITVYPTKDTIFILTVTSGATCTSIDTAKIYVRNDVFFTAGEDMVVCQGDSAHLYARGFGDFIWNNGMTKNIISVIPQQTTTYTVTLKTGACVKTDDVVVNVVKKEDLSITTSLNEYYCLNDEDIILSAIPENGNFYGIGITGNTFSPSIANIGIHNIVYRKDTVNDFTLNIFKDDFSEDKNWTGYGDIWERGYAVQSSNCEGEQSQSYDVSPSQDNYILGTHIGSCYDNGLFGT
ncbi:MAG: hypothetical protein A2X02_02065, partial [Bacteroidetes bacterium GWF2_29_10]